MKKLFWIILFDVIGSKKSSNRALITDKLTDAILKVNQDFSQECYSPLEITQGDEVASVLISIRNAFQFISMFSDLLSPVEFRTVIVFDELTAGLDSRRSTILDGPAFHKANDFMVDLKKNNKYFLISSSEEKYDKQTEAFYNLYISHWYQLTQFQQKVIRLYQKEKNQIKVAHLLDRKQQQIQNTLTRCKWEIINDAERSISKLFADIDKIVTYNGDL